MRRVCESSDRRWQRRHCHGHGIRLRRLREHRHSVDMPEGWCAAHRLSVRPRNTTVCVGGKEVGTPLATPPGPPYSLGCSENLVLVRVPKPIFLLKVYELFFLVLTKNVWNFGLTEMLQEAESDPQKPSLGGGVANTLCLARTLPPSSDHHSAFSSLHKV